VRRAACGLCVLAVVSAFCACGAKTEPSEPQLLVYLDTDAILPSNHAEATSAMDAPPLFDHIRIDGIHRGVVCDGCTHDFDVFKETFSAQEVSFGVVAPLVAGDAIRARLYLSAYAVGGVPPTNATIDVTATLPALPSQGTLEATLYLLTSTVGRPEEASLSMGSPAASLVGTWAGAKRVDCGARAPAGEVCVPGGAFWMGNPLVAHLGDDDGDELRLVVLSPFFIDSTEVTVAAYRPLANTIGLGSEWAGQIDCADADYCTFTEKPGPYDDYPMNCLGQAVAASYCQRMGKELPSEAQFEYVASGLASHSFVWGEDEPTCADAVLERAGLGYYAGFASDCQTESPPSGPTCDTFPPGGLPIGGPAKVGTGALDQLTIDLPSSTGTVYDLVGNVAEIMQDSWEPLTGSCWGAPGVYRDPVCTANTGAFSLRGGDWTSYGTDARAAVRETTMSSTDFSSQLGFRCVRPVNRP
jgi:formylglycine-generating enzyme